MKDKAALIFLLAAALLGGTGTRAQPLDAEEAPPNVTPAPTGDLLEFTDGSSLHGELKGMDAEHGLHWEYPAAKNRIDLHPAHIDAIHFAHAGSVTLAPTCHLRFVNGDDLFGSLNSLDNDHLGFNTWFGGSMNISRAAVQTITFLSKNYELLYEGPYDETGWVIGHNTSPSWTYRDGTFTSGGPGSLGRDFGLTGSSTIEFDLAWSDVFELLVNIYTAGLDHMDYAAISYILEFTRSQVGLRYIHTIGPLKNLGNATLPIAPGKNKIHVAIQCNRDEGTLAVFIDNVLAKRWKDTGGFVTGGGGILFQDEGMTAASVKLSHFKISRWEGRYEPETAAVITNVDAIRFINHDQATGQIDGIKDGKVSFGLGTNLLQIPLPRVTQINFAATNFDDAAVGPWEVRAHFPGGGSLSFQLKKWDEKGVEGSSAIFGSLGFQPGAIRDLEFNLHRPKTPPPISPREFEDLDE